MDGSGEDALRDFLSQCGAEQGDGTSYGASAMSQEGAAAQTMAAMSMPLHLSPGVQFASLQPVLQHFPGHIPPTLQFPVQGPPVSIYGAAHPGPPAFLYGAGFAAGLAYGGHNVAPSMLGCQMPPMGLYAGMWAGDPSAGPSTRPCGAPLYPPPVPEAPGGHGQGNLASPAGRGRRGGRRRGTASPTAVLARTRSVTRREESIANSANFANSIDVDDEDNNGSSDGDDDNDSLASSIADNADVIGIGGSAPAVQAAAGLNAAVSAAVQDEEGDAVDSGVDAALEAALADYFGKEDPIIPAMKAALEMNRRNMEMLKAALLLGMYYYTYFEKRPRRVVKELGIEWVEKTLSNPTSCYNMFRMNPPIFEKLHDILVRSYGVKSTSRMSSREALGIFLWMVGPPESVRQAEHNFTS
ncbi:hypothetical protein ACP4OV_023034 [Aristida adscensionis]